MAKNKLYNVEVAYAEQSVQFILPVAIAVGSTIQNAIVLSGILAKCPQIKLDANRYKVGIFGEVKTLDHVLADGERVEIYRPLYLDPKEARRVNIARREKLERHERHERHERREKHAQYEKHGKG